MRTIKFRIWDDKEKYFTYSDQVEYESYGGLYLSQKPEKFQQLERLSYLFHPEIFSRNWENITIQQFTGLTDKAGREIYEGDIIKCDKYYHHTLLGHIEFKPPQFLIIENKSNHQYNTNLWFQNIGRAEYDLEIIGNIFENKNLLDPPICSANPELLKNE